MTDGNIGKQLYLTLSIERYNLKFHIFLKSKPKLTIIGSSKAWLIRPMSQSKMIASEVKATSESLGLSSSISQLTYQQNYSLNLNLKKYSQIEKHKTDKVEKVNNADCKEMLKTARVEIRRATYQLSTLVTDGEMNTQLFNGVPHDMELLESLPTYCKVLSKKETAPCKVTLEYNNAEDIKMFRVKVYVSYTDARPSKKNYTFKFHNKKVFNLYPLDNLERKFKNEHIYFALESIRGCSINMKVEFSADKPEPSAKKKTEIEKGVESPHYYCGFGDRYDDAEQDAPKTDRIQKYVKQMGVWKRLTQREKSQKKQIHEERLRKAIKKKQLLVKEDIK